VFEKGDLLEANANVLAYDSNEYSNQWIMEGTVMVLARNTIEYGGIFILSPYTWVIADQRHLVVDGLYLRCFKRV